MKMNSTQYGILSKALDSMQKDLGKQAFRDYRKTVKFANDQFVAFVWSVYYEINSEERKIIRQGLDDTHIETALKQVLKEYR